MIAILIILTILIILDAIGDGLRAREKQLAHHVLEAIQIVVWFFYAYTVMKLGLDVYYQIWALVFYTSLRIMIFNPIINIVMRKSFFYLGNTNYWDRFMRRNSGIVYWINLVVMIGSIWRLFN